MEIERVQGCLFGMALGDALGADTEFLSVEAILEKYPPNGPQAPAGSPARVTDDTQMALAVGEALASAPRPYAPQSLAEHLTQHLAAWYDSPENNRAPGRTCMTACANLINGLPWHEACDISSKGCGANMRVMPVGVLRRSAAERAKLAQFQAAFTHGHPTGLAAADLTAYVIADLGNGGGPDGLPERALRYARAQREVYHADWLGDLWKRAYMMPDAQTYIAHGWDECINLLEHLAKALVAVDPRADPCLTTGQGWVAEEAFAAALLCFMLYPDEPLAVIRRAAVSSGDSDSIACIAGAFAGACHGMDAWPEDWIDRIEYHDRLLRLSSALYSA